MNRTGRILRCGLAFAFVTGFLQPAYGQEPDSIRAGARHSLGVNIGLNDFHIKDQYLSPLIFGGLTFSSQASFRVETESWSHAVDVYFSKGHLDFEAQPRDVTEYVGHVSYLGALKLTTWVVAGSPLDLWLGGGVSTFVTNTDFNTIGATPADIYYDQSWYWSHALNVHLRGTYRLTVRRQFSVQVTSPLIQLVTRPRNGHHWNARNQEVHENFLNAALHGRREFFWENLVVFGQVEYLEPLGDRLSLHGTYGFTYASTETPFTMAMYANQFMLGIDWEL